MVTKNNKSTSLPVQIMVVHCSFDNQFTSCTHEAIFADFYLVRRPDHTSLIEVDVRKIDHLPVIWIIYRYISSATTTEQARLDLRTAEKHLKYPA